MGKINYLKVVITSFILVFLSCDFDKNSSSEIKSVSVLTKKEYDSLRKIVFFSLEPEIAAKAMFKLSKEIQYIQDDHELAKRYRLMVWYYLMGADYEKSDIILDKLQKYYNILIS